MGIRKFKFSLLITLQVFVKMFVMLKFIFNVTLFTFCLEVFLFSFIRRKSDLFINHKLKKSFLKNRVNWVKLPQFV